MDKFLLVVAFLLPYLLGSVNFSILISKKISGKDIRDFGSGNAGATNMLRTHGKKAAIFTLILDILKGVVAVLFGNLIANLAFYHIVPIGAGTGLAVTDSVYEAIKNQLPYYNLLAGMGAVLGHNFPLYFKFKGGKGVATSLGVMLALDWKIALIALVFALAIMATTRYVSLGSVMAAIIYVAVSLSFMVFEGAFSVPRIVFDVLFAGLLIFRHRENIKRLLNGTENKLGKKKEG